MVRPAETTDLSRIAEILVFAKRTTYRPIFRDDVGSFQALQVLSVAGEYARRADYLRNTLVYDDGIVKGMLRSERNSAWQEEAELCELYVDPFFWRAGIGRRLMDYFLREATKLGVRAIRLWVIKENAPARAFYEAYGFSPTGEERLIEGTSVAEVRYSLTL